MVLVERRLVDMVIKMARNGGSVPSSNYHDFSDEESDDEYGVKLDNAQPQTINPVTWAKWQLEDLLRQKLSITSDVPLYPILHYLVNSKNCSVEDEDELPLEILANSSPARKATEPPRTYDQALSAGLDLSVLGDSTVDATVGFREQFSVLLQKGFRVVKHAPHHAPRVHKLWLSRDSKHIWWQPAKDTGPPQARFRVGDIHIVLSYPPERLVPAERIPSCFMLVFDLGQSAAIAANELPESREIRRRMVVFETVNYETKHLLVDGFKVLKSHTDEGTRQTAAENAAKSSSESQLPA